MSGGRRARAMAAPEVSPAPRPAAHIPFLRRSSAPTAIARSAPQTRAIPTAVFSKILRARAWNSASPKKTASTPTAAAAASANVTSSHHFSGYRTIGRPSARNEYPGRNRPKDRAIPANARSSVARPRRSRHAAAAKTRGTRPSARSSKYGLPASNVADPQNAAALPAGSPVSRGSRRVRTRAGRTDQKRAPCSGRMPAPRADRATSRAAGRI